MQNPDNFNPRTFHAIKYYVGSAGVNADWWAKLCSLAGHFWKRGKKLEQHEQTICIAIGLIQAPSRSTISPDSRKIDARRGTNRKAAATWH